MGESNRFWRLCPPESDRNLAEWHESVELEVPRRCPVNPDHQRSGPRRSALTVVLPSTVVSDFIWTWAGDCLVTERVLRVLSQAKITGYEVREAAGRYRREPEWPQLELFELVITGWGGVAPPASGVSLLQQESCAECGLLVYSGFTEAGSLIDTDQWDGSDMFIVWPYPRFIFVSDRVADVIRSAGLTGADLVLSSELKSSSGRATPGRLAFWMPTERARELGVRHGID